ncbi:MAG: hypothetical protein KC983_10475 [Phycisphaerales bacterium]|nr:hypothetical protein [Phycisphaerales bacterium]
MRTNLSMIAATVLSLGISMTPASATADISLRGDETSPSTSSSSSATAKEAGGDFVLVDETLETRPVRLVELDDQSIVFRESSDGALETRRTSACVAIFSRRGTQPPQIRGMLLLADGQILPGSIIPTSVEAGDTFAWDHPWLGRLDLPLDSVRFLALQNDAQRAVDANADVVQLKNGDRLEGFVLSLADPMVIEIANADGTSEAIHVAHERVVSVTMVTPDQRSHGSRLWFRDGTVLDTSSLRLGDDGYLRLETLLDAPNADLSKIRIDLLSALLLSPDALIPLASLPVSSLEAPPMRYRIPAPRVEGRNGPLGLGSIRYHGPLTARYTVPGGVRRFAADAELPLDARVWGDCELVIRSDDREVFRARLSADAPSVSINTAIDGSELTIDILEGANGPVQDVVELRNAMLLRQTR